MARSTSGGAFAKTSLIVCPKVSIQVLFYFFNTAGDKRQSAAFVNVVNEPLLLWRYFYPLATSPRLASYSEVGMDIPQEFRQNKLGPSGVFLPTHSTFEMLR